MGDEEAFLRAIRDNPGDDGPKLVYADWLEERGDAMHAELIRLTCELNHIRRRLFVVPARIMELGRDLDSHWLRDVFGRFRLILHNFPQDRKIPVIKAIRMVTGYDPKEARDLSERLPAVVIDGVTWDEVDRARGQFADIATVITEQSTRIEPYPPGAPFIIPTYRIILRRHLNGAKNQTVKALKSIMGLTGEAARELVETLPRVLAERMTLDEVEQYRAAFRPFAEIDAVPMSPPY
jgi:uncharacterized protein (TIGR02996 family)